MYDQKTLTEALEKGWIMDFMEAITPTDPEKTMECNIWATVHCALNNCVEECAVLTFNFNRYNELTAKEMHKVNLEQIAEAAARSANNSFYMELKKQFDGNDLILDMIQEAKNRTRGMRKEYLVRHFAIFTIRDTARMYTVTKPVGSWDLQTAKQLAKGIKKECGSMPIFFRFLTRSRSNDDLDSHLDCVSCRYIINGKIETVDEIRARKNQNEKILIKNMEKYGWNKVFRVDLPFAPYMESLKADDVVLEEIWK